jgi:hypothetical protein
MIQGDFSIGSLLLSQSPSARLCSGRPPQPYGIHTRAIRPPYARNRLRSRRNRVGCAAPCASRRKPCRAARHFPVIHRKSPRLSTGCPQEISMLRCYFLEGIGPICDGSVTATDRKEPEAGRRRPPGPERDGNGTSEPGCPRNGTGPERKIKCLRTRDFSRKARPERSRAGSSGASGDLGRTPSGGRIGKASGLRVARHDAKTASEHLTPVPAQAKRGPPFGKGPVRDAYRVYAPVFPIIHARALSRNHIWASGVPAPPDRAPVSGRIHFSPRRVIRPAGCDVARV